MKLKIFNIRIEVRRVKRKGGYSRRKWTNSETDTMLRLWNEGKNKQEIADLLNRTPSSIYARYQKVHNA